MGAQAARIGERLHREIANVLRMLALEVVRELKRTTPIDTGHARRNWIPTLGAPNEFESIDGQQAAAGVQAILTYQLGQGAIWVSNVVPYIRRLNAGTSEQAPAAFVELAIDRALTTVRSKLAASKSSIDLGPMQDQFRAELAGDAAGNVAGAFSPFGGD